MSRLSEWLDDVARDFESPDSLVADALKARTIEAFERMDCKFLPNIQELAEVTSLSYKSVRTFLFGFLTEGRAKRVIIGGRPLWMSIDTSEEEDGKDIVV